MRVHIVGADYTPLTRHLESSVAELTAMSVRGALQDAGASVEDIEFAVFANTRQGIMEGQHGITGQCSFQPLGLNGIPVVNTNNACASSGFAFAQGASIIEAGMADVVLVTGTEKMWYPEDMDRMYEAFRGSWDVHKAEETSERLLKLASATPLPDHVEDVEPDSVFMAVYASLARHYMAEYGLTEEHLAAVASKSFEHGSLNPRAHRQRDRTSQEVLEDRMVAWPLTRSMCAPISDGSGSLILCSDDVLERFEAKRAVRVRSVGLSSSVAREPADFDNGLVRLAGDVAYERAGVGPKDIDVAEVHDATAFAEVLQLENLRLYDRGEAGPAAVRGETRVDGRLPVNTSGGLLSKGHPTAATGAIQVCDVVSQLRGEATDRQVPVARLGLTECGGGFYGVEEAATCVSILEAPSV